MKCTQKNQYYFVFSPYCCFCLAKIFICDFGVQPTDFDGCSAIKEHLSVEGQNSFLDQSHFVPLSKSCPALRYINYLFGRVTVTTQHNIELPSELQRKAQLGENLSEYLQKFRLICFAMTFLLIFFVICSASTVCHRGVVFITSALHLTDSGFASYAGAILVSVDRRL